MKVSSRSKRVTARDVALASGVSQSTVSFVLNSTPGQTIPEHTRDRVLEAATRLGYVPNASAQILAGGQSRFVIIAMQDLPFGDIVSSFEQATVDDLLKQGFIPVLAPAHGSGDTSSLLALAATLRPAAIITAAPPSAADQQKLRQSGNPRILSTFSSHEALLEPFTATGEAQAQHLATRGHDEVGFVRAADPSLARLVDARMRGVARGCTNSGVTFAGSIEWTGDLEGLARSLATFLLRHPRTTAVAAYNDQVALAVMAAARKIGVEIPSKLAVVGADNLPMSGLVSPTLSSAAYEMQARARENFKDLILSGEEVDRAVQVKIGVVEREST